ncbi:MAG: hypothetical protein UW54_C0027G0005 [Parcubacteria group bacterium GW2011_GWC1_44_26]|nr:MAG: hypothetical protein UW54_C0027G0005 [Parcubacteria group bacterium GW2011_GWC1_44_26]
MLGVGVFDEKSYAQSDVPLDDMRVYNISERSRNIKTFFIMKALHVIAFVLVIVGGINWGLVGINPSYNLVSMLVGGWPVVEQVVYILVGLSAIYLAATHKGDCRTCSAGATM